MYAGNIGASQDFETMLAAAEMLREHREIQWIVIGDGRSRAWLEEEVRKRRLTESVSILGPFPPERMPPFFALADVLLASLRREDIFSLTMPQKLQAYLACGRAVIVAIDGEAARVVAEAGAGLATPAGDPAGLADAVLRLYGAPRERLEMMGRAGREYFEREFDRDILLARLEGWMRELSGAS
jgi:glycosyltransferase involved in cell wall biosynthesis